MGGALYLGISFYIEFTTLSPTKIAPLVLTTTTAHPSGHILIVRVHSFQIYKYKSEIRKILFLKN